MVRVEDMSLQERNDSLLRSDSEIVPDELEPFLREVDRRLRVYGDDRHGNRYDLLEELVFIILSAQTEEYLYIQTFADLLDRYPTWDALIAASEEEIESVIRRGA